MKRKIFVTKKISHISADCLFFFFSFYETKTKGNHKVENQHQ